MTEEFLIPILYFSQRFSDWFSLPGSKANASCLRQLLLHPRFNKQCNQSCPRFPNQESDWLLFLSTGRAPSLLDQVLFLWLRQCFFILLFCKRDWLLSPERKKGPSLGHNISDKQNISIPLTGFFLSFSSSFFFLLLLLFSNLHTLQECWTHDPQIKSHLLYWLSWPVAPPAL